MPICKSAEDGRRSFQAMYSAISSHDHWRGMSAIRISENVAHVIVETQKQRSEASYLDAIAKEPIHGRQCGFNLSRSHEAMAAQMRLQVSHEQCRRDPFTG